MMTQSITRFAKLPSNLLAIGLSLSACQTQSLIQAASLSQSQWQVTEVNGHALPTQPTALAPFLRFNANGHAIGRALCNRLVGVYTQKGNQLSFESLGSTRIACLDDAGRVEAQLLEAYRATKALRLQNNILLLRDGAGQVRVRLQRAPASS